MDEIKDNIQKSILRWFVHAMQMREKRIHNKILLTIMEVKRPRGRPRTRWIDQSRKDKEIIGKDPEAI